MDSTQKEYLVYILFQGLLKLLKVALIILASYIVMSLLFDFPLWMTILVAIGIIILV